MPVSPFKVDDHVSNPILLSARIVAQGIDKVEK
jgi:hypothetical protein